MTTQGITVTSCRNGLVAVAVKDGPPARPRAEASACQAFEDAIRIMTASPIVQGPGKSIVVEPFFHGWKLVYYDRAKTYQAKRTRSGLYNGPEIWTCKDLGSLKRRILEEPTEELVATRRRK